LAGFVQKPYTSKELLAKVGEAWEQVDSSVPELAPLETKLAHAGAQGVRVHAQDGRRAALALDASGGTAKRDFDVPLHHGFERGKFAGTDR
jgi:hypothetical protein